MTKTERLTVLRQNAAIARHAKREKSAARWQQHMAWARRGAADRVAEIEAEMVQLRAFLTETTKGR